MLLCACIYIHKDQFRDHITFAQFFTHYYLKQATTLDDLYEAHDESTHSNPPTTPSDHVSSYKGSIVDSDRRLPMFGWTTETVALLVVPMVLDK